MLYVAGAAALVIGAFRARRAFLRSSRIDGIQAFSIILLSAVVLGIGRYREQQRETDFAELVERVDYYRQDLIAHNLTPPRILSTDMRNSITATARRYAGISVLVISMGDSEPYSYGTQIAKALQDGGWRLDGTRDGTAATHESLLGTNPAIPPLTIVGELPAATASAAALQREFERYKIVVEKSFPPDPTYRSDILVFIGSQNAGR